jgi:LemA protein
MQWSTIILLALVIATIVYIIGIYNRLVSFKNRYENAFAQIEVQLKRRYDLIPNLIETAKGYLKHERETLESVIAARDAASALLNAAKSNPGSATAMKNLAGAESALASSLGKLNVVVEAYPDLKANENMMQLSEELTSTENKVSFARQAFNDAVTAYNEFKQSFPPVIFAGMFGHSSDASLLIMEDSEEIQAAPKVSF